MNKSESIKSIAEALALFNAEVRNVGKDRTNPHFKNEYATLDALIEETKPLLSAQGLSIMQFPSEDDGQVAVTTLLLHKSGEWMESPPLKMRPVKNDPQGAGSVITYLRRYSYAAVLSLALGDDDDGNASTGRAAPPATPPARTPSVGNSDLISEGQAKMIRAKTIEAGYKAADAADLIDAITILLGRNDIAKFADIKKTEFDSVIKWLAAQPKGGESA